MDNPYDATPEEIAALAAQRKRIPGEGGVYQTVQKWANTPTADFVCVRLKPEAETTQFLLVRRAEPPWKGQWFVPGGRIAPNATPEESCRTNAKRELGFVPSDLVFVGHLPVYNPESQSGGEAWFSLWHLYQLTLTPAEADSVKLDATGKEFAWFDKIQDDFPEPVKKALKMVGFD